MMGGNRSCYVVSYFSNPEESCPVAVYETLGDAKAHEPGEWDGDGTTGEWFNGSFVIACCLFWPAQVSTPDSRTLDVRVNENP